jgi:uncharacterized protein YbjT (DUF2867 family)
MYTIAGVSGQVGSAVANDLLSTGADVRVLVRDAAKGKPWAERGADVSVADLRDPHGLAAALGGSQGAFILLPLDLSSPTVEADTAEMVAAIGDAVATAGVPQVVALSSIGGDLPDGTGAVTWLHRFEERLRTTGATLTAVRSGHFQEKARDLLGAVHAAGIYPVLRDSADVGIPMVAFRDVAAVIATALREAPGMHQVIDVEGPEYTERQVAETISALIGRPIDVVTIPRRGWAGTLVEAGLSPEGAELIAALYDADQRGILRPAGDRLVRGRTALDETLPVMLRNLEAAPIG